MRSPASLALVLLLGGACATPAAKLEALTPAPAAPAASGPNAGAYPSPGEFGAGAGAPETPTDAHALEELLQPIRAAHGVPALAAAVFSSDALLAIGAVGVRKAGDAAPVSREDRWHLGSDTKAMTATLHALLVAEAALRGDLTLEAAFPTAPIHPAFRAVTLEQLLRHRGGAPADVPPAIWGELWKDGDSRAQRLAAVHGMLALAPAPGEHFVYSNAGYMMVGAALEEATGQTWESMMRERLFAPLGMRSCGFGPPASVGRLDQPWGHRPEPGGPFAVAPGPGADNPAALGPAGTVHCSLEDWGRFLRAHLKGARGVEPSILDVPALRRLQTPPAGERYSGGWNVGSRTWAGGTVLVHDGSNTMFHASAWLAPQRDRAFVVVTNIGGEGALRASQAALTQLIQQYAK